MASSTKNAPSPFNYLKTKPLKTAMIGVAMVPAQREEIHAAMQAAGFTYPSEGMRAMLLGFARSEKVREVLLEWLNLQPPHYDR